MLNVSSPYSAVFNVMILKHLMFTVIEALAVKSWKGLTIHEIEKNMVLRPKFEQSLHDRLPSGKLWCTISIQNTEIFCNLGFEFKYCLVFLLLVDPILRAFSRDILCLVNLMATWPASQTSFGLHVLKDEYLENKIRYQEIEYVFWNFFWFILKWYLIEIKSR